jgi:hypothetical protein
VKGEMTEKPKLYRPHWEPTSLNTIIANPHQPPPWLIHDLLPKDSGILCSGHPHSQKSLNWLSAAIESVTTHRVWSHFDCPQVKRVLYIETEDPRWLVEKRVHGFCKGLALNPEEIREAGFYLSTPGPFTLTEEKTALFSLIDHTQPDWIVLSTLQGLLGGADWKEQKDMGPINALLVKMQRMAPTTVITHSPHNEEARRAAGSITQEANYATTMHFKKYARIVNVISDSKMGTELNFNLRLLTEDGEVRQVLHEFPKEKEKPIVPIDPFQPIKRRL